MNRQMRRQLQKLSKRNFCSFCARPFPYNSRSVAGLRNDQLAIACEYDECIRKLDKVYAVGVVTTQGAIDALRRGGVNPSAASRRRKPFIRTQPHDWTENDRRWFETNPTRSHHARLPYPDEPTRPDDSTDVPHGYQICVLVRQVEPGIHLTCVIYVQADLLPIPDDEALLHAMFDRQVNEERILMLHDGAAEPDRQLAELINRYKGESEHGNGGEHLQ
jgi:hypothetical protein